MIKRLFGETKEAQLAFLTKKMIITAILVIIAGIIAIFLPEAASIALAIAAYVWGLELYGYIFRNNHTRFNICRRPQPFCGHDDILSLFECRIHLRNICVYYRCLQIYSAQS